jgi:tetratricopeptide (TPR) repeat protein
MRVLRLASLSLFVLLLVLPHPASAQKDRFFGTLPALYRSLAGVYGDEGPEVAAHVENLSQALAAWDRDAAAAERSLRAKLTGADERNALDIHVELLLLYVERGRLRDALREIDDAIRIDPTSAPRLRYKALLHLAAGSPGEAAEAFRAAWLIDPLDSQNAYWVVARRSVRTTDADVERALGTLRRVEADVLRGARRGLQPAIPVLATTNDDVGRAMPFAPAAYARPLALLLRGEFDEGMAALELAVAADPLVADPALRLEPMSRGVAALRQGAVGEAIEFLTTATSRAADSSEAHRLLGTAHSVNGDTAEAVRQLRLALQLNPRNERASLTLARTLEATDNVEEAALVLRNSIAELPDAGAVRWLLSTLSPRLQRSDNTDAELIAVADRLVMIAGRGELYGRVADLARSHLSYERALGLLEQRVALTPNNPTAHSALGSAYIDQGHEAEGYAELVVALLIEPDNADALTALGRLHLGAERYGEAVEVLQRAVALQPSGGEALRALGDALVHAGRTAEGQQRIEDARRAQEAAVEEQRRLRTFGMLGAQATLSMQRGEAEQAIALWRQVIELDRSNAGHQIHLSEALLAAGRPDDAAAALRTAISLGGGPEAHRRLAEVLAALGRSEESAIERQQYRDLQLQELRGRSGGSR